MPRGLYGKKADVKILGVYLDKKVEMKNLLKRLESCKKSLSRLKFFGVKSTLLRRYYRAVGESYLRYSAPVLLPYLSQTEKSKIKAAAKRCASIISGAYITSSVEPTMLCAGLNCPLKIMEISCVTTLERLRGDPN